MLFFRQLIVAGVHLLAARTYVNYGVIELWNKIADRTRISFCYEILHRANLAGALLLLGDRREKERGFVSGE